MVYFDWKIYCPVSHPFPHWLTEWLINYMGLSTYWEATGRWAAEEFSNIAWNPAIHYRVLNNLPLVPALSQMNPVHIIPFRLRFIFILSRVLWRIIAGSTPDDWIYCTARPAFRLCVASPQCGDILLDAIFSPIIRSVHCSTTSSAVFSCHDLMAAWLLTPNCHVFIIITANEFFSTLLSDHFWHQNIVLMGVALLIAVFRPFLTVVVILYGHLI
jgi:hypothetical protein